MAGISNANPEQIRLSNEILGGRLVSVQNQFSPAFRSSEPELVFATNPASPFCRGARWAASARPVTSARSTRPSSTLAAELGVSPQKLTLAWMLAKSTQVIPIPGSSRPETIRDSYTAIDLTLTPDQVAILDAAE